MERGLGKPGPRAYTRLMGGLLSDNRLTLLSGCGGLVDRLVALERERGAHLDRGAAVLELEVAPRREVVESVEEVVAETIPIEVITEVPQVFAEVVPIEVIAEIVPVEVVPVEASEGPWKMPIWFWALPVLATAWIDTLWLELPPPPLTVNDWSISPLSAS